MTLACHQQTIMPHMQLTMPTPHTKPQLIHHTLQYPPHKSSLTIEHIEHEYKTLIPNTKTHFVTKEHKVTTPTTNKKHDIYIQPTTHDYITQPSYIPRKPSAPSLIGGNIETNPRVASALSKTTKE